MQYLLNASLTDIAVLVYCGLRKILVMGSLFAAETIASFIHLVGVPIIAPGLRCKAAPCRLRRILRQRKDQPPFIKEIKIRYNAS
jgi:hypothetical protein